MVTEYERFVQRARSERGGFFDRERSITLTRAPGWVDLCGGVVSEVGLPALLWPTGNGVFAALQPDPEPIIRIKTGQRIDSIPCMALVTPGGPREYADAVAAITLHQPPRSPWWGPALMAWVALMREEFVRFGGGARLLLQIADGPGVAASVIAAVAQALVTAYGAHLAPRELALTCAEGLARLDGRWFDLIGPLTTVCAAANELLIAQTDTATISSRLHLPVGYAIWVARAGTEPRQPLARLRLALADINRRVAEAFPAARERATGAALTAITTPAEGYALADLLAGETADHGLADLAAFALAERQRARIIAALLRAAVHRAQRDDDLRLVGELLSASHWAQARLRLTDPHADALARQLETPTILGARQPLATTHATLVVFGRAEAEADLQQATTAYQEATGMPVTVTGGSVAGVSVAGARQI